MNNRKKITSCTTIPNSNSYRNKDYNLISNIKENKNEKSTHDNHNLDI